MPTDSSELTPEFLATLSEPEQEQLLEELKAELAAMQGKLKGSQREAVKRIQKALARQEPQLEWFNGEIRKIDDLLGKRAPEDDSPDQRKARKHLQLARTFYRAGRKMLAIHLQELRADLAQVAVEIAAEIKVTDPFSTYDYRRASADADLAAARLMMIEAESSHKILAFALGVKLAPDPAELPVSPNSTIPAVRGSRELAVETPIKPTRLGSSSLALSDEQPAPGSLGLDDAMPVPARLDPVVQPPPDPGSSRVGPEAVQPAAAPEVLLTEDEEEVAAQFRSALEADPELETRSKALADQLCETLGVIIRSRELMAEIATSPPEEGARILDLHIWNHLNGKVYFLQRLGDQVADSPVLGALFPQTQTPALPFGRGGTSQGA